MFCQNELTISGIKFADFLLALEFIFFCPRFLYGRKVIYHSVTLSEIEKRPKTGGK